MFRVHHIIISSRHKYLYDWPLVDVYYYDTSKVFLVLVSERTSGGFILLYQYVNPR